MAFAENLQYLRKKNKLTQEELADELEVSRQSVSKWETGEAYPETEKLIALSERFGVTLDGLVRGDLTVEREEAGEKETADGGNSAPSADVIREWGRLKFISTAICSTTMLLCAVVYVILGFLLNLWHPGWLIFFAGCIVCTCVGPFTDVSPHAINRTFLQKLSAAICGSAMIASVGAYLLVGFLTGLWHPYWVIILGGVVISGLVGGIMGREK